MFQRRNVEAFLKSVVLNVDQDRKMAKCQFRVAPAPFDLVREISPKVADRLFRLNGKGEWTACEEMPSATFDVRRIPRQRLEFAALPGAPTGAGVVDDVQITRLIASRAGIPNAEFALDFSLRFPIGDKAITSRLVIDLLESSVFLSFEPAQKRLFDQKPSAERGARQDAASLGTFINNRQREHRGDRPAGETV